MFFGLFYKTQFFEKNMSVPYGALKRRKGGGHAMLAAAQAGGDPARSAYVKSLKNDRHRAMIGNRIAQSGLHMPRGRSGIRHVLKSPSMREKIANRNQMHHHDIMRKYNRGKVSNGIKSHILTYAKQ